MTASVQKQFDEVQHFIDCFFNISAKNDLVEVFTNGCCYWFAYILCARFSDKATMMYDPVSNHFVAEIDNRLFDVTGEVTSKYNVVEWETYEDDLEKERIINQCVNF